MKRENEGRSDATCRRKRREEIWGIKRKGMRKVEVNPRGQSPRTISEDRKVVRSEAIKGEGYLKLNKVYEALSVIDG